MLKLPNVIVLPAGPTMPVSAITDALGVTRQCVHWYRQEHSFPRPTGNRATARYDTREVTAWLTARGAKIIWV